MPRNYRQGKPYAIRTLTEVAEILGLNREQARELENRAFRKLAQGLREVILSEPRLRDSYGDLIPEIDPSAELVPEDPEGIGETLWDVEP